MLNINIYTIISSFAIGKIFQADDCVTILPVWGVNVQKAHLEKVFKQLKFFSKVKFYLGENAIIFFLVLFLFLKYC